MKFNFYKCKVLHIENNNQYAKFTMNSSKLSKDSHEINFWITINNDLKSSKHYSDIVKTANRLVGFIRKNF